LTAESLLRTWDRYDIYNTVAGDTIANNDILFRAFACARPGGDRRLFLAGTDTLQTSLRSYWTRNGYVRTANTFTGTGQILEMAANSDGSVIIAVGFGMGNKVQRSTDGQTFSPVNTHSANNYKSCCYLGGAFYAIEQNGPAPKIGISGDGIAWGPTAMQPFTSHTPGLCRGGKVGGLDAVLVYAGSTTFVSTNYGAFWNGPGTVPGGATDIRYNDGLGLWMAVGSKTSISVDGFTWIEVNSSGGGQLATDGGNAWVTGGGGSVAYSLDVGKTWKSVELDSASSFGSVCWHPVEGRFYALTHVTDGTRPPLVYRTPAWV
jgi:hypothetical protein